MLPLKTSSKFKKDMKSIQKSGRKKSDLAAIKKVIDILAIPETLDPKFKDHPLSNNYKDYRECHIFPDLLLMYNYEGENEALYLYRIGSHSELF